MDRSGDHNHPSSSVSDVTEQLVKRQSGEYDAELVLRVSLDGFGLVSMSGIRCCPNLVELSLSQNLITRIDGLDSLSSLQKLDLSYNKIESISGLSSLFKLQWLDLRCNQIADASSAASALAPLVNLKTLFLYAEDSSENNPVCSLAEYRRHFLETLPQVVTLDGSHSSLLQTMTALESRLASIHPDPQYTRALPLQPWFEGRIDRAALGAVSLDVDLEEESASASISGGTELLEALAQASGKVSAAGALDEALEEVRGGLRADSSKLLRKADEILARQKRT